MEMKHPAGQAGFPSDGLRGTSFSVSSSEGNSRVMLHWFTGFSCCSLELSDTVVRHHSMSQPQQQDFILVGHQSIINIVIIIT